jgi:hypothetical protein
MWTHHRRHVDGGRAMNDLARARRELAAVLDREEPEYAG